MNNEVNFKHNPLNGVSLKNMLNELVSHYGFDILFAYLNINCFKTNPSIESSAKFLKKTEWAREKVEVFYMYKFKNLPRVSSEQFEIPPRDRIVPEDQTPKEPAKLSLEDAERLREKNAKKTAARRQNTRSHSRSTNNYGAKQNNKYASHRETNNANEDDYDSSNSPNTPDLSESDPWANAREKFKE